NAFLGDFGIIKALTTEATDWRGNSLTAPGFLVGTPNYVAPEVVMGRTADGQVDQYSLAMTVYEILTGNNCMEGPTPSATVVNLLAARDRWGELHVDYPEPNMWNEHPYYILDVPWSNQAQRAAAADFLAFLMSEPIQRQALEHGFRPGNPDVSIRFADSPLLRHAQHGLQIHLPGMCEPPRADTIKKLLTAGTEAEPKGRDRP